MQKFNVFLFIMYVMMLCCIFSIKIEAKECEHEYKNDVCDKCGYIYIHSFDESISFYTIKDKVPTWSEPTKKSILVENIEAMHTEVSINGLLRNQYGNIWLKRADGKGFVYCENVYINFLNLIVCNYGKIESMPNDELKLMEFYDLVRPDGIADYKKWLDPSSKGILYNVYFGDSQYRMTAEELGNIHYGYLGKLIGFEDDVLLYAGGVVNQAGKLSNKYISDAKNSCIYLVNPLLKGSCVVTYGVLNAAIEIYEDCSGSYCDTESDAANVRKGIDYYKLGTFD